jgi:hypothetical protein
MPIDTEGFRTQLIGEKEDVIHARYFFPMARS